jgi:phosphoglycolate phosphatase-like HAD superfamily hydrolase
VPDADEPADGRLRVLVDVDGVIADQLPRLCECLRAEYGVDVDPTDVDQWSYQLPDVDAHIGEVIDELHAERPGWFLEPMEPVPGVVDALDRLRDHHGHEVAIATHRPATTHDLTVDWLATHDVPYDHYVHDVPANKADLAGDVLIDDYHGNVADALAAGKHGVLFRQRYSDPSACPGATVATSWRDVVDALTVVG